MPTSMILDQSVQLVSQITKSISTEPVTTQNGPQDTNSDTSNPATTIYINDMELEEARGAVTRLSVDHPEWLNTFRAFASLLMKRFEETGRYTLLANCIGIQRQICTVCMADNPDRALSLSDLASSLRTYFKHTGEESLLTEAIDLNREALSLRPIGHSDRSTSCIHLAAALWTCFNVTGEQSLLTEAINLEREALSLRAHGHPDRSQSCNNLAVSLWTRFNQTGEEPMLLEAIELNREALSLRTGGHPDRYKSCNNLANSLWTRFTQTGKESLLAEAIELDREALSLRPGGHPDRSILCNDLARSIWTRFKQTGEESLLAEAIALHREALSLRACGHPDRSQSCNYLAGALWTRFKQTGEESLLAESIELYREALALRPGKHPDRSQSCSNLAGTLWTRFIQTGEESLLTESIELYREALSLRPGRHPLRSYSCSNLGFSLHSRFKQAREKSLLVEAINLHREALLLQTSTHPDRWDACNGLVASLRTHFEFTGDESLLVEAIDLSKDIMETRSQNHPSRWNVIINLCHIYLNRRFSRHNTVLAIDYIQQAISLISDDWPALLYEVIELISLIDLPLLSQDSLSQLLQCFSAAMDLASRVAGFVLDPQSQLQYLNNSQHLGPRAYWCALTCGQPQLGLELIERARAMIWTQALYMRNPQLDGAPPELASELEVLLRRMNTLRAPEGLTSSSSHDQDVRNRHSDRIHQLIRQIRALPGQERFMRGLSFKELVQCASHNPVVVLVATEGECHALILSADNEKPVTLELSDIAPEELTAMSIVAVAAQRRGDAPDNIHDDNRGIKVSPYKTSIHHKRSYSVLEKLWMTIVRPIIDVLGFQKSSGSLRPRLHWCPTGPFMFLPFHAAGIYDRDNPECCTDYVVCSYTPTLSALLRAQKSNPSFHRRDVKLGLIAVMQAWDANLPPLPNVEEEISNVRDAAERASISIDDSDSCIGDAAVVSRVAELFKSTNLVHIACHGRQNTAHALSSGFCLSDESFNISRLMDLDLKDAFFAFLSACETAKGDERQPDQTVHLAAAMLFAGIRSVVGTMWAMEDVDGPQVAKLFYKRLFEEEVITRNAIPYALDYAVSELKASGVPPARWATFVHMGA